MTCPSCGTQNQGAAKFCIACGTRLALACPACGMPTVTGARFCAECGASLAAEQAEPTPPAPRASSTEHPAAVAERRLVTVLFADLVGFTTLSEDRDAEEVRELLSAATSTPPRTLIERYGGTVEKFIGDAVMAVWGTPVGARGRRRARGAGGARAGRRRPALGERSAPGLQARAGVLTGEAAVTLGRQRPGHGGRATSSTRPRGCSRWRDPGTVLVGEAHPARAAERRSPTSRRASTRSRARPSRCRRSGRVRVVSEARRRADGRQLEAPFVGPADRSCGMLKDLLHAAGDGAAGRVSSR